MQLTEGQRLHGFTVNRVRRLEELGAVLYEMTHDKTGAELCWFNDGDENKLFSAAFKTIPEDSTGVFHILEHTVLNGSDNFPVKEPFVELLKGSLNTFLNAMTFPDKTIYPVSSRNRKDFLNLTKVYLDAVFNPLIGKNPNIFRQEGWHIELTDANDEPVYKGVVFNEMKGATSSVDDAVESGTQEMLFPGSPYRHNSGGDPRVIPTLTYEKYIDTYKRFYHPSNCRFWLDGDLPIDETLEMIDAEYLSLYERRCENHDIAVQEVLPAAQHTVYTELSQDEAEENKAQLVFARIAANWDEFNRIAAINVLASALCGSNDAPLSRAILKKGLGQDISMTLQDGILQPVLALRIHNTEDSNEAAVRETIRETVKELVDGGIDRSELEAILNKMEFDVKQPHEPQGLIRNIQALSSWLYGGDPACALLTDSVFAFLRGKLSTRYWEELLEEIMDEKFLCLLHVLPSKTLGEERRKAEADRLAAIRSAWTDEELEKTISETKALMQWQQTPDSPEALAMLPALPVSEINPEPEIIPTEESSVLGARVLTHSMNCKGVVHVDMLFSLNGCDYPVAALMTQLYGSLPTDKHDSRALVTELKRVVGSYSFDVRITSKPDQTETCSVWLNVSFSALESRLKEAEELMLEMMLTTSFTDHERIKELVLQEDENLRQAMVSHGHILALTRASSHYSADAAMQEKLNGLTNIHYSHELAADFDARIDGLEKQFAEIQKETFCRSRLVIGVASTQETDVEGFISRLPEGTPAPESIACAVDYPMKEAVVIPAQICYASMACLNGVKRHGSADVLRTVANFSYLWNEVRVKGGAYGSGMSSIAPGTTALYSFRDPTADKTLGVYRNMAEWLRGYISEGASLDNPIISAVGAQDRLSTVRDKAHIANLRVLNGATAERLRKRRSELINTTHSDIEKWLPMLENLKNGAVCVIGHKAAIDACADENLTIAEI